MRKLTTIEVEAAKLLHDRTSTVKVCEVLGMQRNTLFRLRKRPDFIEYMELLGKGLKAEIITQIRKAAKQEVATLPIIWNRAESAKRKLAIADDRRAKNSDKLAAGRALDEMYGILKAPVPFEGETAPEAPDVYQAEWMRKPQ